MKNALNVSLRCISYWKDVFPIEHGDIPASYWYVSLPEGKSPIIQRWIRRFKPQPI